MNSPSQRYRLAGIFTIFCITRCTTNVMECFNKYISRKSEIGMHVSEINEATVLKNTTEPAAEMKYSDNDAFY